jgi:hypothetical protein
VNDSKTERNMPVFFRKDCATVILKIGKDNIRQKKTLNVLGVIFDLKLQWNEHVAKAITKSNYSLNGLKLIRKYFSTKELVI